MLINGIMQFVAALGNSSIEVHEWSESDVRKKRLSNSPDFSKLTTRLPNLQFSGWSLAHAVVKADYLDQRSLTMPGLGFLLQSSGLIDFGTSPIQLKAGTSNVLNDFSGSSLSGRVAQGFAILYGHSLGLKFTAHLSSYVAKLPGTSLGAKNKKKAMADFLFAGRHGSVLIESKGSFSSEKNDPTALKSVLKDALTTQIDPWMGFIQPTPTNGYVVYTCLREESWDASALIVVDPSGDESSDANLPLSREQIMRENYGAWLRAMGLNDAAIRLTDGEAVGGAEISAPQPMDTEFLVYAHRGRSFAVLAARYLRWPCYPWEMPMLGLDITVLDAISAAIVNRGMLSELLADLPGLAAEHEAASIFPDGSFLGMALSDGRFELKVIKL